MIPTDTGGVEEFRSLTRNTVRERVHHQGFTSRVCVSERAAPYSKVEPSRHLSTSSFTNLETFYDVTRKVWGSREGTSHSIVVSTLVNISRYHIRRVSRLRGPPLRVTTTRGSRGAVNLRCPHSQGPESLDKGPLACFCLYERKGDVEPFSNKETDPPKLSQGVYE